MNDRPIDRDFVIERLTDELDREPTETEIDAEIEADLDETETE